MDISTSTEGACTIVSIAGRMDATSTDSFDAVVKTVLEDGVACVLLDMKELVYISSAGLRSLLGLAKSMKANKARLGFCGLQPMVAEVFRIAGFDRILTVYDDRAKALSALVQQ